MSALAYGRLRRFWLNLHLWIGVGLCLLAVPVSLTGSLLVWNDEVEAMLEPQRHAVTGFPLGVPLATLVGTARQALGEGAVVTQIRLPTQAGQPASVVARLPTAATPRETVSVWMDPPTARVLDMGPTSNALMRLMHDFHANLLVPQWSGRQVVGWVGVGMLILSLSGIYLWWPRRQSFARALGWRTGMRTSANLHHVAGFWISIPLAVLSLTGMYISFPQTARAALGSLAPLTAQAPRAPGAGNGGGGGQRDAAYVPLLSPDAALEAAQAAAPASLIPATITLPTAGQAPGWRVVLSGADGISTTVTVDDASGAARAAPPPAQATPGDLIARWIRWLHVGNAATGTVWQVVIFIGGLLPALFAVTGMMMWLRRRKTEKAMAARRARNLARAAPAQVSAPAGAEQ